MLSQCGHVRLIHDAGFYLEGTIFPPAIDQAYVYVSSHGSAIIGMDLVGRVEANYDSGKIPIIPPVFWPGVSCFTPFTHIVAHK